MLEIVRRLARKPIAGQFARFVLVGLAATVAHYSVMFALVRFASMAPVLATSIGYCVGIVFNYMLSRTFTFRSDAPVASSFAKFALVYGVGLTLNGVIVGALAAQGIDLLLAQIAATGLVLGLNFLGSRFVAFRQ